MKQFMNHINVLLIQTTVFMAVLIALKGLDWIDIGRGLHPMFAGALVAVLILAPHLVSKKMMS